jgi:ATP-dependent DNA helicase RecG
MFETLENLLKENNKVYVVCPLINSDNEDKKSVSNVYVEYYKRFSEYGVGYLHGKMSNESKNETLEKFKQGETKLLISTTVIEV